MSAQVLAMRIKLVGLPGWLWRLRQNKLARFVVLSLAADAVGYSLVYWLTSRGILGSLAANESVSKLMSPVGLFLNTLAFTGRLWPKPSEFTKWLAYWFPSAALGAMCTTFVVMNFDLGSPLKSRAVAGMMIFPLDYMMKRFVIFDRQAWLGSLLRRVAIATRPRYAIKLVIALLTFIR